MNLFTVAASLMMASTTLGSFGLLASLIVMERRPRHAGAAARRANLPPHAQQSALVAWPAADRGNRLARLQRQRGKAKNRRHKCLQPTLM